MESKLKHLDFIQAVINRFNANCFLIKGWAVALVSALFALAAKDANQVYMLVTYISVPTFWILDAYYLSKERQYRSLFDVVRNKNNDEINFSMDVRLYCDGRNSWLSCLFATTMLFYVFLVALPILIIILSNNIIIK